WAWLDDAIGVLGDAGLEVVMCTPTATPPKWLVDERPEILPWGAQERPRRFGSRRHYSFSSPAWHEETRRICSAIAGRYGDHPAVVGWQLDNEYGCHDTVLSYAPHCRPAFRSWLRARYGDIGQLNEAWGTVFWSQEYGSFDEIDPPNMTVTEAHPSHRLDYWRFSSDQVADYNQLQAGIVREHSPGRFITHNFMGFFVELDHGKVAAELDVAAWDSYPLGFTSQRMGLSPQDQARFARTGHPDTAAFNHDLYRGLMPNGRFWVMEQQPGPVNWAPYNPAPADGMVRLWTLEALAHGAEVVSYFRWRQAPFAEEQMHTGLNRPDGVLDQGGKEAALVAAELPALDLETQTPAQAPVALLHDEESAWAFAVQPQGAGFDYQRLFLTFYTALRRLGVDVDIKRPDSPLEGYPLVVVPSLPILDATLVRRLRDTNGACLFGPRSGSRTASHRIPEELPPGPLQAEMAIKVARVESLPPTLEDQLLWGNRSYPVRHWREAIESDLDPEAHLGDGDGAIYGDRGWHYLAFWPDETFLTDYLERLLNSVGVATMRLAETTRIRRRGNLTWTFNYDSEPIEAPAPRNAHFVLGQRQIPAHGVAVWRARSS
ncbi:MAG: beta-galactosidase, partial [Pseudomonadota bacterium]